MCVFSGIQFTGYLIEFVLVEVKQIVSSNSNVISTRQTCGQRSGMAEGSKRRELPVNISVRICYMFLISKCREESDLGLCMTSVLANSLPLRSADFRQILQPNTFKTGSRHCAAALSLQVPKSCTDLDPNCYLEKEPYKNGQGVARSHIQIPTTNLSSMKVSFWQTTIYE